MKTHELLKKPRRGCWIDVVSPKKKEINQIAEQLGIPKEDLISCLDEQESPRISKEKYGVLILIRTPYIKNNEIVTLPLAMIIKDGYFLTLHLKEVEPIKDFLEGNVRKFVTDKRTRLLLQIFSRVIASFMYYLKKLEDEMDVVEQKVFGTPKEDIIVEIWKIRRALIHLNDAVIRNGTVLENILRGGLIKLYKEDQEIIEDLIIENRQLVRMLSLYTNLIASTTDAYISLVSNNLNVIMKKLTSFALIMSVPILISGLYGMNVRLPLQNYEHVFILLVLFSFMISLILLLIFKHKQWL
jgi:magnesium transporter